MNKDIKLAVRVALAATITTFAPSGASALPMASEGVISRAFGGAEEIGLVCDDWGRCWRSRPAYYRGWGPSPYYGGGWQTRPSYYYGGGWGSQPYGAWNGGGWRGEGWYGQRHHEDDDD